MVYKLSQKNIAVEGEGRSNLKDPVKLFGVKVFSDKDLSFEIN